MCGLAGALFTGGHAQLPVIDNAVHKMCDRMRSRGPDAGGYWRDPEIGLVLGHRRLSILDLDARSNQPMISEDGRYVIAFNGEIYNFAALRREQEARGSVFRTQGDTEVLLSLFSVEGEAMLTRLRGMFAIAIWDRVSRQLFLARDPYGIKPLYLARCQGGWLFASQVKALLASGLVSNEPDPLGQAGFWLLGSVPEPHTWFRDVSAMPPGHWCRIAESGQITGPYSFCNIGDYWREAPECQLQESEAQERVRTAVSESVRQHLVADVPVGVFLSGGIDSGSVAGLIQDAGVANMQGITIAFNEFQGKHEDEVPSASEIAQAYGFRHHVRTITKAEFKADFQRILSAMDQPSIDGINTWYASKAVSELGLKVVLSGVGGDELFYGYPSFRQLPNLVSIWGKLKYVPRINQIANGGLGWFARRSGNLRWQWLAREADNMYGAYWLRRGLYTPDELPLLMGHELAQEALKQIEPSAMIKAMVGPLPVDSLAAVGQLESMVYLRNQLLRDSDWASMDHSVELRTPLVDAWLLRDLAPVLRSFGRLHGKHLLAASPTTPLKQNIIRRAKTGFGIPLGSWMDAVLGDIGQDRTGRSSITQGGSDSRRWAQALPRLVFSG